ncbi:MAG: hypothetical protein ACM3KR_01240 [Deltaproteobacteria bacterium]
MPKKIIALIAVLIIILIPFSSMAEISNSVMDDASQKADRTKKDGDKAVDKASKNFIFTPESERQTVDIRSNAKNTNADQALTELGKGTYSTAWRVLIEFQRNSFPVCLVGIIIGALITNVLGPRNMIKKKLGISLMFGFLSFWVIAQVAPVVFWVLIQ